MSRLIDAEDAINQVAMIAKALAKSDKQKALCGRIIFMLELRPTVKAIPLERVEQIREEIKKSSLGKWYVGRVDGKTEEVLLLDEVLDIIDKALKEQNE